MMSKKQILIFLTLIIVAAAFLRLYKLDSIPPGLYPDEAMNGNNALEALKTGGFKWFYPENNGREGLFINIQALSVAVFGNEPWALRGVSTIVGILTVLGLFLLAKELFRKKSHAEIIALFSSFFLAVSFWHVMFSRIGFRAIMAPLFLVWSFYFLWKVTKLGNGVSTWKPRFQVAAGGLLFGLGFHTYIAYRVAPLLLIFPFAVLWKNKQKKIIALFLLFAFLAALPLGVYFLKNPHDFMGRTSQVSIFSSVGPIKNLGLNVLKTIGMFFVWGDGNWRHNLPHSPELWWPISVLFLLGMAIGAVSIIKNLKTVPKKLLAFLELPYAFLFSWLILMLLPVVISNEGIPHALRAIAVIPPVFIFAGVGMKSILTKIQTYYAKLSEKFPEKEKSFSKIRKKIKILIILFLAAAAINTYDKYFFDWAPKVQTYDAFSGRYLELGRYFNSLSPGIQKYVIINADGVDVRGLPMPSQTIMFITDTFLPKNQKEKNITYLLPGQIDSIKCAFACKIATLEINPNLREKIKEKISGLKLDITPGIETLTK